MSNTYKYIYLPIPPRAWSRVNLSCTYDISNNNIDPLFFQKIQEINKGNVLQFKKNSSQLTRQQKYSQIAKGLWTNRTKTWATQSDLYTNPNTLSLKRVAYKESIRDDINNPFNCPNQVFKDGGSLLCNSYENPCTGQTIKKTFQSNYYPTTASNVPGPIKLLYWDPRLQTWFPKVKRTMNNSTNKWPINYKLFTSAIRPTAPVLSLQQIDNNIKLSWTILESACIPITNFYIYQSINDDDFILLVTINNILDNYTIENIELGNTYSFYIIASSTKYNSEKSNIVTISV